MFACNVRRQVSSEEALIAMRAMVSLFFSRLVVFLRKPRKKTNSIFRLLNNYLVLVNLATSLYAGGPRNSHRRGGLPWRLSREPGAAPFLSSSDDGALNQVPLCCSRCLARWVVSERRLGSRRGEARRGRGAGCPTEVTPPSQPRRRAGGRSEQSHRRRTVRDRDSRGGARQNRVVPSSSRRPSRLAIAIIIIIAIDAATATSILGRRDAHLHARAGLRRPVPRGHALRGHAAAQALSELAAPPQSQSRRRTRSTWAGASRPGAARAEDSCATPCAPSFCSTRACARRSRPEGARRLRKARRCALGHREEAHGEERLSLLLAELRDGGSPPWPRRG